MRRAENTVVVVPGANALVTPSMVEGWAEDQIETADVVVLQGEISAESNLAAVRLVKGRLVVNLAPVIEVDREVLLAANPLVVNEHEGAAALAQLGGPELTDPGRDRRGPAGRGGFDGGDDGRLRRVRSSPRASG